MPLVNDSLNKTLALFAFLPLSLFLMACNCQAQTSTPAKHWLDQELANDLSRSKVSKPGGSIVSFPCDPMMNAKRENEILEALSKESPFGWGPKTSLKQMAADLSKHVPVVLDIRALEEIGMNATTAIGSGALINGRELAPVTESERTKWWNQDAVARSGQRPKLVVDLLNRIKDLELTILIRHGQVVITTIEAAEDDLAARIYDVTPLVSHAARPAWQIASLGPGTSESYADFESLINIIQTTIVPDTWEALGGNSTFAPAPVRGRNWLLIATTSEVHWQIQRMLDRMNQ
ncbi:MAG: hypothetical protein KDB00_10320 [Planctomycetales bacterium]|nr:hypothetical protein [Planctomycetales bacterium]